LEKRVSKKIDEIGMFCSARETKCISEFDYDNVTTGPNIIVKYKDIAPADKNNRQPHN